MGAHRYTAFFEPVEPLALRHVEYSLFVTQALDGLGYSTIGFYTNGLTVILLELYQTLFHRNTYALKRAFPLSLSDHTLTLYNESIPSN